MVVSSDISQNIQGNYTKTEFQNQVFFTPGPEVIKLFPFILLINVKMPTVVGISTFISMINTTSERLKAINFFICLYFSFISNLNFMLSSVQLFEHEKVL